MKRSIKFILIFFGYQLLTGIPAGILSIILAFLKYGNEETTGSILISAAFLIGSLLTIWHFIHFKYIPLNKRTFSPISLRVLLETLIAGMASIIILGWLQDIVQLPNLMKDTFAKMDNVFGVLAICLVGPIAEEIIFRGGIESELLKKWKNPKWAILVSALIFGLIHVNPAQVLFAFLIGLLLGWIYYRTGSLLLVIIIHVVNNSLSTWMSHLYSEDVTLTQLIGEPGVYIVVAGALVCLALSIWRLNQMLPEPVPATGTETEAGQDL